MRTNLFCPKTQDDCLFKHDDDQRRREDAAALQSLIADARRVSPTAAAALDWAEAHGVIFTVDRSCRDIRGYYVPQAGIVAMAFKTLKEKQREDTIGTLTHEIRHAWQDYHGLLGNPDDDVLDAVRSNALFEADAYALQKRAAAEAEYAFHQNRKPGEVLPSFTRMIEEKCARHMDLHKNFRRWFADLRGKFYGPYITERHAEHVLGEKARNFHFENKLQKLDASRKYLDSRDAGDLRLLTTDFAGKPYIPSQQAPRELLDLTEPSRACRFFASDDVSEKFNRTLQKQLDTAPLPPRLERLFRPN
jgi:hypothetical protein